MEALNSIVFTEKYRPRKVLDVISSHSKAIKKYLEDSSAIPNFLFSSKSPGTGKTSMAYAIINELGCDKLILNASDDRTLEVVRNRIKNFALTLSSNGKRKAVFLDEFDGNLKATQESLRNIMETYSKNCFFILTCNNIEKVIEPIKSRCVYFDFSKPDKLEIFNYLINICKNEDIPYNDNGIKYLIDKYYPNIRNMVSFLQDSKIKGIVIDEHHPNFEKSDFEVIIDYLKSKKFNSARLHIIKNGIDIKSLNRQLFDWCLNNNELSMKKKIKLIQICAKNERDFSYGADEQIIFVSSLPEIILTLTKED